MRKRRAQKAVLWLCLLLQTLLGVPAGLGLSVCVDADGCHAIEIAHAPLACPRLSHDVPRRAGDRALQASDDSCRDVPVLEGRAYEARVGKSSAVPLALASLPLLAPPPALWPRGVGRSDSRAPREASHLLHSVVLTL